MSKKPGITCAVSKNGDPRLDDPLGEAVERENGAGQSRSAFRRRSAIQNLVDRARRTLPQMVGKAASDPTSVVYFQQRSHFCPAARSTFTATSRLPRPGSSATCDTMNSPGSSPRILLEQRIEIAVGGQADARLERRADELLVARGLQALQTSCLTSMRRSQLAGAFPRARRRCPAVSSPGSGNSAMWTLSGARPCASRLLPR